ncbi:hypothetical protein K2X14_11505 [Acetobacter sp. TBRC 12305]|uniref:Uncharacterized protein n=1 Tax=Acetobacter garciniae TaxID=2817435 RepID=A0A939HP07_9PROT|nr:hypothetical protein [Acetobacter garciniae]MBO1325364.1 hypothetical protein [Acetobacter garciniae]MBX0345464.1 hypothetical protein [Acetobacter garciniae]
MKTPTEPEIPFLPMDAYSAQEAFDWTRQDMMRTFFCLIRSGVDPQILRGEINCTINAMRGALQLEGLG